MHRIIIQPGRYRGLYEVIVLRRYCFFIFKGWQKAFQSENQEERALTLFYQLQKDLGIRKADAFDLTGESVLSGRLFKVTTGVFPADTTSLISING